MLFSITFIVVFSVPDLLRLPVRLRGLATSPHRWLAPALVQLSIFVLLVVVGDQFVVAFTTAFLHSNPCRPVFLPGPDTPLDPSHVFASIPGLVQLASRMPEGWAQLLSRALDFAALLGEVPRSLPALVFLFVCSQLAVPERCTFSTAPNPLSNGVVFHRQDLRWLAEDVPHARSLVRSLIVADAQIARMFHTAVKAAVVGGAISAGLKMLVHRYRPNAYGDPLRLLGPALTTINHNQCVAFLLPLNTSSPFQSRPLFNPDPPLRSLPPHTIASSWQLLEAGPEFPVWPRHRHLRRGPRPCSQCCFIHCLEPVRARQETQVFLRLSASHLRPNPRSDSHPWVFGAHRRPGISQSAMFALRVPFYLFPALVAVSRVASCVHWPSDAFFGSLLGLVVGEWVLAEASDSEEAGPRKEAAKEA